jgi:hypothetical protein
MKDWKKITEKNVIKEEKTDEESVQYVSMKERNLEALQEQVREKSHLIKTYPDFEETIQAA